MAAPPSSSLDNAAVAARARLLRAGEERRVLLRSCVWGREIRMHGKSEIDQGNTLYYNKDLFI